jgi:exopolyphosphatase/guanosine-5'-triphosphate,3'-diphosphate pyrophosphatase
MNTGLKFAAIDIGSNAIRLLLSAVFETDEGPFFRKISLIRMPIRLGEEAFIQQRISTAKIDQMVQTITGFRHLMEAYQPLSHRACATSAMREAQNQAAICDLVEQRSGIRIQVIDGKEEADIIFPNGDQKQSTSDKATVFLDVGGGSTEITIFSNGQKTSNSFNIGTIRVMEDMVTSVDWDNMKRWVRDHTKGLSRSMAIGSGGNIHRIIKLAKTKDNLSISMKQMVKVRKLLEAYTVVERITTLGLKPDRADVILPAHRIYHSVMKWGRIPTIQAPQMGLADGMVRQLYGQYRQTPA